MSELALPFVLRVERTDPPTRTDALEAAARGVLLLLDADVPRWQDTVRAWDGQRIRKVVRRARGAAWRAAAGLDCLDATYRSAQLRVYPPVPVDDWPPELAKLQVGGTVLTDPSAAPVPAAGTPLVLLSPHAQMTTGKAMAQAAHAAQLGWRTLGRRDRARWVESGFRLAVRDATTDAWDAAVRRGHPVVHDGGFTEVEPGTATALFTVAD